MLNDLKEKFQIAKDLIQVKTTIAVFTSLGMLGYDVARIAAIATTYLDDSFDKEDRKLCRDIFKNGRKEYKDNLKFSIEGIIALDMS